MNMRLFFTFLMMFFSMIAFSQSNYYIFTGNVSEDWHDIGNWVEGKKPLAADPTAVVYVYGYLNLTSENNNLGTPGSAPITCKRLIIDDFKGGVLNISPGCSLEFDWISVDNPRSMFVPVAECEISYGCKLSETQYTGSYIFTGTGSLKDATQWASSKMPSDDMSVITIEGTAGLLGGTVSYYEVYINQEKPNARLTLNAGSSLTTEKLYNSDPERLYLLNTAAASSSLIIKSVDVNYLPELPKLTVKQVTSTSGDVDKEKYHLFSSPVGNISKSDILRIFDGFYLDRFNETTNLWERFDCDGSGWTGDSGIETGRGYAINHEISGKVLEMTGQATNQDYTFNTTGGKGGLNLIGNPYTSAINISESGSKWLGFGDGYDKSIWIWSVSGNYMVYPTNSEVIENEDIFPLDNVYIPMCQGFWVRHKYDGNGPVAANASFTIPYSSVASNGRPLYKVNKVDDEGEQSVQRLTGYVKLDIVSSNGLSDYICVIEATGCGEGYDDGWDGEKWKGSEEAPQLYSVENGKIYSINSKDNISETAINFESGISSSHVISPTYGGTVTEAYLVDNKMGITHDLSLGNYSFNNAKGDSPERFKLIVKSSKGVTDHGDIAANIKVYGYGRSINVINLEANHSRNLDIYVYDMRGVIVKRDILSGSSTTLQLDKSGIYIVKVGGVSKKIVLN